MEDVVAINVAFEVDGLHVERNIVNDWVLSIYVT
jgi:hypothetical protein